MKTLIGILLVALAAGAGSSQAQAASAQTNQTITWVFLNTGPDRAKVKGMTEEAVRTMQGEHVGNFGTQFNRGTLMAAGPLGDNGFIRGTVILAVNQPEEVSSCFKLDPFVQQGILGVEAHPWLVDLMQFGTPKVPFQLARHTLCVVKKGKTWAGADTTTAPDSLTRLLPSLKHEAQSGDLALSGPFTDVSDKFGVLLFYSSNQAPIQARMEKEPSVLDGRVVLEFHPQFLGLGTLHDPQEDLSPPKTGKSIVLFDGSSFAGWQGDTQHRWRIENQALVGGSLKETVPHNDFLCTTRPFKNFDLRLKVKLEGTGFVNGGIQLRSQRLKEPAFEMSGYQADMGEGYWGSLYDESRRNRVLAHGHAAVLKCILRTSDWNDYVIRCENSRIRLWFNGVLTVDYTEDQRDIPLEGLIGLQIHGGGKAQASYKDISIEELP
jgi:hypothetical protein